MTLKGRDLFSYATILQVAGFYNVDFRHYKAFLAEILIAMMRLFSGLYCIYTPALYYLLVFKLGIFSNLISVFWLV